MLYLTEDAYIASGYSRTTYHHPHYSHLCVKIVNGGEFRKVHKHRQKRDVKFLQKLQRRGKHLEGIPYYFGEVETNLGVGYVYEKVTDYDGQVSQTLAELLSSYDGKTDREGAVLDAIRALGQLVYREKIIVHDKLPDGNVLCRKNSDESYTLFVIDGIGDTVLIPVLNYLPHVLKKRVVKRWIKYLVNPVLERHNWIVSSDLSLCDKALG